MSITAMLCASHSPLLYCYKKEPKDWAALQDNFRKRAEAVAEFEPELVIAFGSDHFNGFFLKMMPAFCIGLSAEAESDIGGFPGVLDVPGVLATDCVDYLRQNDVDVSVSYSMTIDHAFSQTIHNMTGAVDSYPLVPVFINSISKPYVPFRRSRILGEVVGRFVKTLEKRVLLLASGGMSHHPARYYPEPGQAEKAVAAWQLSGGENAASLARTEWLERLDRMHHEGAEMIARGERTAKDMRLNPEMDQAFLDILCAGDLEKFDDWEAENVIQEAGIGFMELHSWIAAAAAQHAAGGNKPVVDFYSVAPEIGIACGVVHAD